MTTLLHVQNATLFCISVFSLIYYTYNTLCIVPINNHYIVNMILVYCFIDLFFTKSKASLCHHICCITLGYCFYNYMVPSNHPLFLLVLKTETTSIFLVCKNYISKNSMLYNINNVIFAILFFKIRIVDQYYNIFDNNSALYLFIKTYSAHDKISNMLLISGFCGLYILNIYWFCLIIKMVYKLIYKQLLTNKNIKST
jgi:hypothetical protein